MGDIVLRNVNFFYNKQAILEDINLDISRKDFLAIIGPNGGGKTTLLKLILGLLEPSCGEILIFGKKPKQSNCTMAYVPQNTNINIFFPITVLEVVLMGRLNRRWFSYCTKEDKKEALNALEQVGMSSFTQSHIGDLSGGQRQRVFIARALCAKTEFLLLDEPTSSIDTNGQIQIYELLKELNKQKGIIVISHDVNIALGYSSMVAHINKNLYMHQVPNTKQKDILLESFKQSGEHFCPVEIVSQNICTHTKNI